MACMGVLGKWPTYMNIGSLLLLKVSPEMLTPAWAEIYYRLAICYAIN
jgi:hypothetical protein